MNKIFLSGVLVFIVILLFVFLRGNEKIKNYPPKDGPIVAFGDSLVAGTGSTFGNDFVSVLSTKIGESITNLGIPGDTTASGLSRLDSLLDEDPRIVILLLGGNDFIRKVPREETFSNLRLIINKIQAQGSMVLLLGVRGGLISDNADEFFEDLAKETGSAYVPNVLSGLFADSRYMSDAIHPNNAGYAKVADKVYKVLKDTLK